MYDKSLKKSMIFIDNLINMKLMVSEWFSVSPWFWDSDSFTCRTHAHDSVQIYTGIVSGIMLTCSDVVIELTAIFL